MNKKVKAILDAEIDPAFARRAELIFEELEKAKPKKILDAGCGRGFYAHGVSQLSFPSEIQGIDITDEYAQKAKAFCTDKRVTIQKADIYNLPFTSHYFDFIICSEVLEHLTYDVRALRELKRVLKKGGILVVTVPHSNYPFLWDPLNWVLERTIHWHIPGSIWWLSGIWAGHVRLYDEDDLVQKVQESGFTIKRLIRATHFSLPFAHFLLYGVGKNIVERGFLPSLNRFSKKNKRSVLHMFVKKCFAVFDIKNNDAVLDKHSAYVNIVIVAK